MWQSRWTSTIIAFAAGVLAAFVIQELFILVPIMLAPPTETNDLYNLKIIARLMEGHARERPAKRFSPVDVKDLLRSLPADYVRGILREPNGRTSFSIGRPPTEIGEVIVYGHVPDEFGMVWGLTDQGHIIKFRLPRRLTKPVPNGADGNEAAPGSPANGVSRGGG